MASLLLSGVALAAAGCGSTSAPTPQALQLERADLVTVCRTLSAAEPTVASEVAATRAAWPLVVNGLPGSIDALTRQTVGRAVERADSLRVPGLFAEHPTAPITGPGSSLAGLFRGYVVLASRGWEMIGAAIEQIEHGSAVAARFARANVALYIESVYDAHFSLAQIGKKLLAGYKRQGGASAFGASLTPAEVQGIAEVYSEAQDRLHPHTGVRLGS